MNEIWKDIPEYEGFYKINNFGKIKSFHKNSERILKPGINKDGYEQVILQKKGKRKTFFVHRLVLITFKGVDIYKVIADHIDRDIRNNNLSNLRWVTHYTNVMNKKRKKYIGVWKNGNTWIAEVRLLRKRVFLKSCKTEIEAAHAYDKFIIENGIKKETNFISKFLI